MPVWLITGSASGLSHALAESVLGMGHQLVVTARSRGVFADLQLRYGPRVRVVPQEAAGTTTAATVRYVVETFGRLDIVVTNPGCSSAGTIQATSLSDFRALIDGSLLSVIDLAKAVIPVMRAQGAGHLIQVLGAAGRLALPGWAASAAAMCGVEGFSELLAQEVGPLGIKVTTIKPGMEPGDLQKLARLILHLTTLADPPPRLVLGRTALRTAGRATLARIESDRQWRHLSLSAEFTCDTEDRLERYRQLGLGAPAGQRHAIQELTEGLPFRAGRPAPAGASTEQDRRAI